MAAADYAVQIVPWAMSDYLSSDDDDVPTTCGLASSLGPEPVFCFVPTFLQPISVRVSCVLANAAAGYTNCDLKKCRRACLTGFKIGKANHNIQA